MPATWDDFQAYVLDMVEGEDLHVTDEARDLAVQIVMRPPVPLRMRPVLELANQITIGLLPPRLRRQYGFAWDPVRAVAIRGGAEYAKRFVVPFLPERLRVVRSARRACVGRRPRRAVEAARRYSITEGKRGPTAPARARRPTCASLCQGRTVQHAYQPRAPRPTGRSLLPLGAAVSAAQRHKRDAEDPTDAYRGCIPPSSDTTWLVM